MSDGPRSRRPVEIKEGDDGEAGGAEESSRPLRPTRSSRPPKVRESAPPSRRSKTPKPPGVTPKPPGVTPKPPGVAAKQTPKPPGVTPRPPAAKATAKSKAKPSRSSKRPEARNRLDSHAEGFFAEGEVASQAPEYDDAPTGLPTDSIFSIARRQTLMRYVGIALVVSTVLCVAAIARSFLTPVAPTHEATVAAPASAAPAPSASTMTFPLPSASVVASAAPPSASASAPIAAVASAPEAPTKSAAEEKADAQRALERGKAKDAVEAATRSTTIDPSDADAWLILGAANMEIGKSADARTAFATCAKQATRGPVGECRSMLR